MAGPPLISVLAALATALALAAAPAHTAAATTWWKPTRKNKDGSLLRFQYQLSDSGQIPIVPGVQVYAIDIETARTQAAKLKKAGARVVCYFSAGTYEAFRAAADKACCKITPASWGPSLGEPMEDWPDEKWVDVRSTAVRNIMKLRLDYAKRIGCDGVDPDNINGHENNSGFDLTEEDLVDFLRFLSTEAHARGLAIGLKNAGDLAPRVHTWFDWAINEECFTYDECGVYSTTFQNKPVFGVEYCDLKAELGEPTQDPSCFCPRANAAGWQFSVKKVALGPQGISCTQYCKKYKCGNPKGTGTCNAKQSNMCPVLPPSPLL